MRIGHTSTYKGKRVKVFLRDGENIIDRFIEKKSGVVILERNGRVQVKDIRSLAIYKE